MEVINLMKRAIRTCADLISWGADIQEKSREELVADLKTICLNCDGAYDSVIKRLAPIKNAYSDPLKLEKEMRSFAADTETRDNFKPEHICGQVDDLLVKLRSNLNALKYSVDIQHIDDLRNELSQFESVDAAIYEAYDSLRSNLDKIAMQISDPSFDQKERIQYAKRVISNFEGEMKAALEDIRSIKKKTLRIM